MTKRIKVEDYKQYGHRIIWVTIETKPVETLIKAHMPTSTNQDVEVQRVYEEILGCLILR